MTITTKKFHEFPNPAALDDRLASEITNLLVEAIQERGHANLGVSGGRTPTGLFAMLRERAIDWRRVNICLVDERWVKTSSRDSNERTLRETLLVGEAANANFIPLRQGVEPDRHTLDKIEKQIHDAGAFPFDVLTLGMGEDGHTASLFPSGDEIYDVMRADNPHLLGMVVPKTAPYNRVTFTAPALMQSRKVFLHIIGAIKLDVLKKAEEGDNPVEMPIRAFLHNPDLDMEIFWAPR